MATTVDRQAANVETVRTVSDLIWSGDFEAVEDYLTEDFVGHDPMVPDGMHGAEGMAEAFEPMQETLSDVEYEIHDVVAQGDHVFHRGEVTVTHTGEFNGIPASNERFSVQDHIEWRFEGDKIAEAWAQYDVMAMMRGMGVELPIQD